MNAILSRSRGRLGLAACVLALLACGEADPPAPEKPRLAILLVIDQLGTGRLQEPLTGGFRRLLDTGRVFEDAVLDHAGAETCPGHVAVATGCHPGRSGIPGNQFVDAEGRVVYCVDDAREEVRVHGGTAGRSPRFVRVASIGDWLRESNSESRVFSVSAKDRASIIVGGRRPHAAYWLDRRGLMGFTSSRYYLDSLPEWVLAFNQDPLGEGFLRDVPETWIHETQSANDGVRVDDFPGESDRFLRTSGHPVRGEGLGESLERLYWSPFVDDVTLAFARELIEREGLGDDEHPDLLTLSLSGTDLVGHLYGPGSLEARDALQRLDRSLGEFLAFLDARQETGGYVVAMTSDHGVLPLPEWLAKTGGNRCPGSSGRVLTRDLFGRLARRLSDEFGNPPEATDRWFLRVGYYVVADHLRIQQAGVESAVAVEAAAAFFMGEPSVERVWRKSELETSNDPNPLARLFRNSFDSERSGDLLLQMYPTCLLSSYDMGTSHGTPYLYDRAVPLIFAGPGIDAGSIRSRAATVDLAPTLASYLGIDPPKDLDGVVLPLRD